MKRRLHFHSPSEIQAHLNKQRTGGLSVDRYCDQHKIAVSTFWSWRKRYGPAAKPPASAPFARIGVIPFIPMQGFEVVVDNKVTVRFPSRFETESLRSLFGALK